MISLKDIKDDLSSDIIIEGVTCDSRKVKPGYIFVAIQGEINRGEDFIDEAIKKGASVIVTSSDSDLKLDIPVIKDENPRRYLSYISSIVLIIPLRQFVRLRELMEKHLLQIFYNKFGI